MVLAQGFQVAVLAPLYDVQVVGPADEGHAVAARVQQVLGGCLGRLRSVGHNGREAVGQAYAVEEDEGHVDVR